MLVRVLLCVLAVSVMGVRQNCVPVRNPLSNEYICTRVQKWINEISALGDSPSCSDMVNNDLIEAFSTVTEADDCSLNWPTPDYEKAYVGAYADKIYKAYQKYKPAELRTLTGSVLQTNTAGKDTKNLQQRLFKLLLQRQVNGGGGIDNSIADAANALAAADVNTEVHYVRMTAEEYLRRIKANLGDDCEVPRWPCCSELLRKLEEEALTKQLAEQAAAAAAASAVATSTAEASPAPEPTASTAPVAPSPVPDVPVVPPVETHVTSESSTATASP